MSAKNVSKKNQISYLKNRSLYHTLKQRKNIYYLKLYSLSIFQNFENLILNNSAIKGKNC